MEINFYHWWDYYPPINEYNLDDCHREKYPFLNDLNTRTVLLLYLELSKKYPEIKFKPINHNNPKKYLNVNYRLKVFDEILHSTGLLLSHNLITIENPINGKYFIISKADNLDGTWGVARESKYFIDKCVEIFAQVGVHVGLNYPNSKPISDVYSDFKYTPISHHVGGQCIHDYIEEIIKNNLTNNRVLPEKLHFRSGGLYGLRWFLSYESPEIFDFKTEREWDSKKYLDELNQYSINIDINGQAEISCRTLEIMGMGMALIRPKLIVQYHNKLIPNYHYHALDESKCNSVKDLGDLYYEALQELKKDEDYRIFLSKNGREWYKENCRLDNYMKILIDKININKLL
jgi:hypothetical protein